MDIRTDVLLIIIAAAIATYFTRIGGYLLLARFKNIPPRVEAGLDAVPVAVLTAIVAPAFVAEGWVVSVVMVVAFVAAHKFSGIRLLAMGWLIAMALRHLI